MTISYTLQPIPRWVFNDLTGKPAAGGKLFVRSSLNPNQPKIVYQDASINKPYSNPVIFDENGTAPGPFYWQEDSDNPQDLYYLFFTDNAGATTQDPGNTIWSEPIYPISGGGGGGSVTVIEKIDNILVNSPFLYNIGATITQPVANNTFLAPSAHTGLYYPDLQYILDGSSNAQDTVSFVATTNDPGIGINPISPDFITDYYLRYECLNGPSGENYKAIQIPISKNVNNIANQSFTLTFYARQTAGSGALNVSLLQYFGSGGSPSSSVITSLSSISLTGSFVFYTVSINVPSVVAKDLGNSNDDATYIQFRYPIAAVTTIDILKPMLFPGSEYPTVIYESTEEIEPEIDVPRTGDVKPSANPFSASSASLKQNGWIPLNDGTIGNASSGATTRAKPDSWLLYNLLWNNTSATNCPVYTSSGSSSTRGANSIADWNANKQLQLPRTLGRVIAEATPTDQTITTTNFSAASDTTLTVTSTTGFLTGNNVVFASAAPAPLSVGVTYYGRVLSGSTLSIYTSAENAINNTSAILFTGTAAGSISTPVNNALASFQGENSHQQTIAELVQHNHGPAQGSAFAVTSPGGQTAGGAGNIGASSLTTNKGSSNPFNIMQPTVFYNMIIKL